MTKEEKFNVVVNHAFGGWHHVQGKNTLQGAVKFHVYCGAIATVDFDQLTKFVVACHAVRVRGEIVQSGPRCVGFILSEREDKKADFWRHHPSGYDLAMMARDYQARVDESEKQP